MEYETFKQAVVTRLARDIPDPKQISIQKVHKNNGLHLDGLVIMEGGCNIAPTLYLDYYYEAYRAGQVFSEVYETILQTYLQNRPSQNIDVRFFTCFENSRSHIAFKLIHYRDNETLLKEIPHIRYLDLAIVFYCLLTMEHGAGNATILIHNCHLDYWKISVDELCRIALQNAQDMLPARLYRMNEILRELLPKTPEPEVSSKEHYPMFVLSNRLNLFGAGCILYDGLLKRFADETGCDLYILPSSVHEVILLPAETDNCREELSRMVQSVNRSHLAREEILSDHAYYYCRKTGRIDM